MKREAIIHTNANHLYRTRTPWGWLVESVDDVCTPADYTNNIHAYGSEWRTSITFVFDPFHMWKVEVIRKTE